jgi:Icc protein
MRILSPNLTRRDVLVGAASAGVGAFASKVLGAAGPSQSKAESFRFAHLTDLHIKGHGSMRSVQRAIRHATERPNPPKLILTGGDLVYDAMYADERSVTRQWHHVQKAFAVQTVVPVEHVLGNHDIWGVDREKSRTTGNEPLYGKRFAMDVLGISAVHRSFDKGGWHFVLLDDVVGLPEKKSYEGRIDEQQFEWLSNDLKANGITKPVIVLTHIPILGASVFFPPQTTQANSVYSLPYTMMHGDAGRLVALFEKYPNVKLCLSGHTHLVDKVEYKGVTYMGNGAVCGNWWNGAFQGFEPGYSLVDLNADGTFSSEYQHYETPESTV